VLVDVPITEFRRQLKRWLELARQGEEIVVTERGTPVARLTGIGLSPVVARLVREGKLTLPVRAERIKAKDIQKVKLRGEGKTMQDYLDEVR
jgi:prevent-host-death family protein